MKRALAALLVLSLLVWGYSSLRGPAPSLLGLWEVGSPRELADELRFYYFHKGDKGLYRYGQVGANATQSFDWHVSGDVLTLTFRKTGETVRTRFVVTEKEGRQLVLLDDPRTGGRTTYTYRPAQLSAEEEGGPLDLHAWPSSRPEGEAVPREEAEGALAGRMWFHGTRYATGGMGFRMYQLSVHRVADGSLGWYHAGDFDDWTTETLSYRELPAALELRFPLRHEQVATPSTTEQLRDKRVLTLARDPRDFGARGRFEDIGKSF